MKILKSGIPGSGVTENTPGRILLGAGTIHKGLIQNADGSWNFAESLLCATAGGGKAEIRPELTEVEVDGIGVRTKGLTIRTGETATLTFHPVELTEQLLALLVQGDLSETGVLTPRASLAAGDYMENLAYVGRRLDGKALMIRFGAAICTSGLQLEGKHKEAAAPECVFACIAEPGGDGQTLPWEIRILEEAAA